MQKASDNPTRPSSEIKRGTRRADGKRFYSYLLRKKKDGSKVFDELWLSDKAWSNKIASNVRWQTANKERRSQTNRAWRKQNPDRHTNNALAWKDKNREKFSEYQKQWASENRDKVRATLKRHDSKMRKTNPAYVLKKAMRCRIYIALKGIRKCGRLYELIGCGLSDLRSHLENQFDQGMTWKNYGTTWHVDHVFPLAWFDLSDPATQKKAFSYKNLQPLFAEENSSKRDRYAGKKR